MFDALTRKISVAISHIGSGGKLTEGLLDSALSEIKIALLESDVALSVVKKIMTSIKEKATGTKILSQVKPDEQIAKLVYDEIVEILSDTSRLSSDAGGKKIILMAGLQGSGKTTSAAKLARHFSDQGKSVLLASTDIYRPAAKEQLEMLSIKAGAKSLPIIANESPVETARRAVASNEDIIIIDTAGRMQIDAELMDELRDIKSAVHPTEILLAVDAMTGRTAIDIAREFNSAVGITGAILTRTDGDSSAGAALSMKLETGAPILFVGTGEGINDLEKFHPDRIASRILDMGDVVSLVEKAEANIDPNAAMGIANKMFSGEFDLSDMLAQIRQIKRLGNMGGILKLLPGIGKLSAGIKDKMESANFAKQEAIILSMTLTERAKPDIILASRKQRIANGAGVSVRDVEQVLVSFNKMKSQMKQMQTLGGMSGFMDMLKKSQH